MRKKEAEAELIDKRISRSMTFCPLTKALCAVNCECYHPGKVLSNHRGELGKAGLYIQHDDWYVSGPYCGCYSLVGAME